MRPALGQRSDSRCNSIARRECDDRPARKVLGLTRGVSDPHGPEPGPSPPSARRGVREAVVGILIALLIAAVFYTRLWVLVWFAVLALALLAWTPRLGSALLRATRWPRIPLVGGLTGFAASLALLVASCGIFVAGEAVAPLPTSSPTASPPVVVRTAQPTTTRTTQPSSSVAALPSGSIPSSSASTVPQMASAAPTQAPALSAIPATPAVASAAPTPTPPATASPATTQVPAAVTVAITTSRYGFVAASTASGASCTARARLPSGRISEAQGLQVTKTADSGGNVSWSYGTTSTTTPGTGTHTVTCTDQGQTRSASAPFTVQ